MKVKSSLLQLSRNSKRIFLIAVDVITLSVAAYLALSLRQGGFFMPSNGYELTGATSKDLYMMILLAPVCVIPALIITRLYRSITRYISIETYVKITKATIIGTVIWASVINLLGLPIPRSVIVIYLVISTLMVYFTRFTAREFLIIRNESKIHNVLVYGIGESSIKIAEILKTDNMIRPIGFISQSNNDNKSIICGLPVFGKDNIQDIITKKNIHEILVTTKYQTKGSLRSIVEVLNDYQRLIRKLPNIEKITNGQINIADTGRINIEDLLGRDAVRPDPYLLKACIKEKVVLITGCGGSIGSELAKQIIKLNPKKLILLEQSEYFLYEIDKEISNYITDHNLGTEMTSYLGSVNDNDFITGIFKRENINTIYHAAAHKHVPLVEHNPLTAIKTNILGTNLVARKAFEFNIDNFVLISSDKAVRPTNIMGATKRFAELILQSLQDEVNAMPSNKHNTKFCMVRFGNVLDTSGSVVPLFRKQIKDGGPVTVTDPKVIRYFMTIGEATELVIQAGSISNGGEVFLLDMGNPISILSLAKEMIRLSGKTIKDNSNNDDSIEIIFTGLRDGEKLYEELLIGDSVDKTIHEHIMCANEEKLTSKEVTDYINKLKLLRSDNTLSDIQKVLYESVEGYEPSSSKNVIDIKVKNK